MRLIFRYLKLHITAVLIAVIIKLAGTLSELLLPYILEHIIDEIVPTGTIPLVLEWGCFMFAAAIACRYLNVWANKRAVENAHTISYEIRQALFEKTIRLSGEQFDEFTLPSLISRMTSDSYNVQSAVQQLQSLCIRAPMMLIGGVIVASLMDFQLALILLIMLPVLVAIILFVSAKGIPLYTEVQRRLDVVVRMMRENITGIRVVKALSREEHETVRFHKANEEMTAQDIDAATVMAIPGPLMQLFLNCGLCAVVFIGAFRVNAGEIKPGVILAFLTYFNMITMGVMGLSRIFMTISKASASAERIEQVLEVEEQEPVSVVSEDTGSEDAVVFDHVSFSYGEGSGRKEDFAGTEREKALSDISFTIRKGESLGIIGPTGCGKTTIVNLLMRFYQPDEGSISVDGKNVNAYERKELRRKFGTVFQNDMVFQDSLYENIDFGRSVSEEAVHNAAMDAMASDFISELNDGFQFQAAIKGANLSGGQKQRIFVARALAANPEILILDDSSSALDYRTDAQMRKAIEEHHPDTTLILIAQRISSVMNMTNILVMDNGKCIGYGSHEELLKNCAIYRETCQIQMGSME
ncbi:MAG: ABC transporter ATP-binding protein [Solobacterium sp.]|nr:ABC transporter ATP-binding protein [Solobacterium sp.]